MPGTIRTIVALLVAIPLLLPVCAAPIEGDTGGHHTVLLRDREYFAALREAIDEARSEIVMAFFLFKTREDGKTPPDILLRHLIKAAHRGVAIRILLERGKNAASTVDETNRKTAQRLREQGIDVSFDTPRRTTHTKVVVIDRRYTFLGSHNLTSSALRYNHELSLVVDSPGLAMETLRYMDTLH